MSPAHSPRPRPETPPSGSSNAPKSKASCLSSPISAASTITNAGYDETHLGNVEYTIANGGQSLTMQGSSGDVLAAPGGVSGGTTFTDYWHHYS